MDRVEVGLGEDFVRWVAKQCLHSHHQLSVPTRVVLSRKSKPFDRELMSASIHIKSARKFDALDRGFDAHSCPLELSPSNSLRQLLQSMTNPLKILQLKIYLPT